MSSDKTVAHDDAVQAAIHLDDSRAAMVSNELVNVFTLSLGIKTVRGVMTQIFSGNLKTPHREETGQ